MGAAEKLSGTIARMLEDFREIAAEEARRVLRENGGAPANTQGRPKKKMRTKDLAKAMGKSTRTIMNWIDQGVPHEREGHNYVFELEAVQEWHRQRRNRAG